MDPKRPYRQGSQDEGLDASPAKRYRVSTIALRDGRHAALTCRDYTIAWICALPLELSVSRAMLDEEHQMPPSQQGDPNAYILGRIGQHNVVMVCLPGQYGTIGAATVATNLKRTFPCIHAALMVGIGGGCPGQADIHLGDVVVGTRVMQYDLGKSLIGGVFQRTAVPKVPEPSLNSAVSTVTILRANHGRESRSSRIPRILRDRLPSVSRPDQPDRLFEASYHHVGGETCSLCDPARLQVRVARLSTDPRIHYGVIASGDCLMRNAEERDIISQGLEALCFEMEASGIMDTFYCLPIRGISDYSDSHKDKQWQDYAAAMAAAYARELLEELQGESEAPRPGGPAVGSGSSTPGNSYMDAAGNTISLPLSYPLILPIVMETY